ncbi:hypothetical protein [Mycobacterium avium]|uniref:hypothetical protein n=1 Tax=Mycobacterium avium TaxID=1764 RepID=UPI001CC40D98|nr:hypothetical protein [Mycobacterium avium]MBZ4533765.1 hypothetical protein [Mycobacterium avium subsp. hominissuis]MBZ4580001.1 hypothetical protein [Mycobacterium avium subsp. hominissuis]MBZ4590476.1 hypothetical protein [Mycobacterium avium subsp. hominissuis]MBZ4607952.1 hypothetical protein [Mycobacterium avium subsp. hominissuis]MBZ4633215.1 hypothetical protein [Mycobacterium avium subsp. hominissuis]
MNLTYTRGAPAAAANTIAAPWCGHPTSTPATGTPLMNTGRRTIDLPINLKEFPPELHRIVKSWYSWQAIYLRKMRKPLPQSGAKVDNSSQTPDWATQPPTMTDKETLRFLDDYELAYFLVLGKDGYYIDKKSRGSRKNLWMFRRFDDAEQYMLFLISQEARPGRYSDSPSYRWYQEGLHPGITLTKPDPVNYPGRVSITVDGEPIDRGWMPEHDAVAASHLMLLSFEELDGALRQGIPPDWFSFNIITAT